MRPLRYNHCLYFPRPDCYLNSRFYPWKSMMAWTAPTAHMNIYVNWRRKKKKNTMKFELITKATKNSQKYPVCP